MTEDRFAWLAPGALWPHARLLLPPPPVRPQGGGAQRIDEHAMFAAIIYVLVTESPWRSLPRVFGVSWQNCHRRFVQWTRDGLWERLTVAVPEGASPQLHAWARLAEDRAQTRLRESTRVPGEPATPTAAEAGARRGPVMRKVHRTLAERLFGPLD